MKEKLDELLAQTLHKILDGVDATTAFVQEQLPDVVQQVLNLYFVYYSLAALFAVVLFSLQMYLSYYWIAKVEPKLDTEVQGNGTVFGVGIGGFALLAIEKTLFNLQWLKIWIAPKLWLIEYTANLAK